LDKEKKKNLL